MAETDALSKGKFGSDLFLTDFPVKIRVLTLDPMVYVDKWANTKYAFIVFNLDEDKAQILDKTGGFAKRFQEIHMDEDFGADLRKIDIKITTNGKSGKETRYTISPIGTPADLSMAQIKDAASIKLEEIIKKKAPNALRLSEINDGSKLPEPMDEEPTPEEPQDVVIEDIGDEPINLSDIPF